MNAATSDEQPHPIMKLDCPPFPFIRARCAVAVARISLTRTLAHLAALAPEAAHALLAPLGAHAALDVQQEGQGVGLLDARVSQAPRGELGVAVVEAHKGGREEVLGLHRRLDGGDGGGGGHLQREAGPAEGLDEDLHV